MFQGLTYDKETGLYYNRERYRDPTTGKFISADPLGYIDGPNMYTTAKNNALNYADPTGEFAVSLLELIVVGAAVVACGLYIAGQGGQRAKNAGPVTNPITALANVLNPMFHHDDEEENKKKDDPKKEKASEEANGQKKECGEQQQPEQKPDVKPVKKPNSIIREDPIDINTKTQRHTHLSKDRAVNEDGTAHHRRSAGKSLSNKEARYLRSKGYNIRTDNTIASRR